MISKLGSQFTDHGSQIIKQMTVNVRLKLLLLITLFVVGSPLSAEPKNDEESPRMVQMQIAPSPAPYPALKYKLLPELLEQKRGNSAQLYYRAANTLPEEYRENYADKIDEWFDMPISKLPREEVRNVLNALQGPLRELKTASIRETCHWEMPLEDGFSMLLPNLSDFRTLGRILALKAKLEIAEGKFTEAIKTLQTGLALGRDVGKGPTIIQGLVGIAIGNLLLEEVEQFIQAPDSPNLYWALRSLPSPYVDMQKAMELESIVLPMQFPLLQEIKTTRLSVEQTRALWNNILGLFGGEFGGGFDNQHTNAMATGIVMFLYPEAKRKLMEEGYTREEVEAMPAGQVALIQQYQEYQNFMQEMYKWFYVPYWQAKPGLDQATDELRSYSRSLRNQMLNFPFAMLMPALNRVYFVQTRAQRQIASLCCVEAIRMYAAEHDGTLPSRLQDITQVPLPMDPMTGKEFPYKVENGIAILEGPAPKGEKSKEGFRYEITVRK